MVFKKAIFFSLAATVWFGGIARAEEAGIDARTRDALIEKLTRVHLNLAPSDSSRAAITLRLADLHAERARQNAFDELKSGCTKCVAGNEDRKKALDLYRDALPQTPRSSLGKVLTQIGHLHEMNGNEAEAIVAYERILKEVTNAAGRAEAHLSLGEIFFKRRQLVRAREEFKHVVDVPSAASRGLAAYRMAWCDFNSSKLADAINGLVKILRTPELLSRSASGEVAQADPQFQGEVARDLAMFLSRRQISQADIDLVFELSPERERLANIAYFAGEAERLGQLKAAVMAWKFAQSRERNPSARLTTNVHLAQLQMENRDFAAAEKEFSAAMALYPQAGPTCTAQSGNDCKELKSRLRKFVLDWNHLEKAQPSELLLSAYRNYLKVFPQESDMALWAAKVAQDRKQYELAVELNLQAAQAAKGDANKETNKDLALRFENALLSAIENAELAKSVELRQKTYQLYLQQSQAKKKTLDVRYQLAHMIYEKGTHAEAAEALRDVALAKDAGAATSIKKQAAELSLDALVLLKDDSRLEAWAKDYAKVFPDAASGFAKIARKAVLNQSVKVASTESGGPAATLTNDGLEKSWATLARFDASSASSDEKITYYKNRLVLAEKLRKLPEARDAAEQLLRIPELSAQDREFALSRQAWLAELNLDFKLALQASEKLSALKGEARWLKLAMLAELAGLDPAEYYQQFLKISKDADKNQQIALLLVRTSNDQLKEIEKHTAIFMKKPEVLASLYLDVFAKNPSADLAKKLLVKKELVQTPQFKAIQRLQIMNEAERLKAAIEKHQINSKTQKTLAKTLKERVDQIKESEKLAARAVDLGDWTSQILALDLLGKQSERFYQEILALPVPQGLSPEEEQQYLQLLSQQAAPHQTRSQDITKKLADFWANQQALAALESAMKSESGARRKLVEREVVQIKLVAPNELKDRLLAIQAIQEPKRETPNFAALERGRQMLREEPFNRERLVKLLELEKKAERPAMISYLEGRLEQLGGGTL